MTERPGSDTSGDSRFAALVVAGLICQEVGASIAVLLFPQVGALGMVFLRVLFSAVILLPIARPTLRGIRGTAWLTVIGFGLVLALMNGLFYLSLDRIPLGAAVTIEVLGPLVLSVVAARRAIAWLWAGLAAIGVALLGEGSFGALDLVGVALAAGAGIAWAFYILLSRQTGRRFARFDGLAIAMAIGAVASAPFGIASAGGALLHPEVLLLGAAVALLSSTVPYGLELLALRHLHPSAFAILLSLAPAIAALAGLVLLRQTFDWVGVIAVVLVISASIGAVWSARAHEPAPESPDEVA
ncbi:DMT family transporter [Humibacter sp. RRB41]|uniref:EamA family transporter n=1 Tax=Humibacter sp. RRB41 TaxID=2919946 RepID=UPI001FAAA9C3|nr:EamA family transporter [Humibacter sp. RRB41]